jgi:bifunctional non-homologous end joining protein LigD
MSLIKEILLFAPSSGGGKEYKVVLTKEQGDTFAVDSYNGPAGNLRSHTAQGTGLTREEAEKIYLKTFEKKLKGSGSSVYTVTYQHDLENSGSGAGPTVTIDPKTIRDVVSPFMAQLLTPLDTDGELRQKLLTGLYVAQLKADGDRVMCEAKGGVVTFFNRKGQVRVDSRSNIAQAVAALQEDFFIDGEIVADQYYLFDMLRYRDQDLSPLAYDKRFTLLKKLLQHAEADLRPIKTVLPSAGFEAQWALFQDIKTKGEEGIVLHLACGSHQPGKGDEHFKFKLTERSTCIVRAVNRQRSVGLAMLDDNGNHVDVGNVTIPANHEIPAVDDLVEVEYIYKYAQGSLVQPIYLGKRLDIDMHECTLAQVRRYKLQGQDLDQEEAIAA